MSALAEPWKKKRSKPGSWGYIQRAPSPISNRKQTKLGQHMSSDGDVQKIVKKKNEDDDDDDDEEEEEEEEEEVEEEEEDYSEEDEDSNLALESERKRLGHITSLHKDILDLLAGSKEHKPKKSFDTFGPLYKDVIDAQGEDKRTILHTFAKWPFKQRLQPFLRWYLQAHPQVLLVKDSYHHTALYTAIANHNWSFVKAVCKHSEVKVEALEQTGSYGTCLHKALELQGSMSMSVPVFKEMISVLENARRIHGQGDRECTALRKVLCSQDHKGNTPLHVVLKTIAGCDPSETAREPLVEIASSLIEKQPDSIYVRNDAKESPYDCLGAAKEAEVCKNMLDGMKKIIMRKWSHDKVIDFLYANGGNGMSIRVLG